MKVNTKALAITLALLWGGSVCLVAVMNRIWPSYGVDFLGLVSSIYPGYHVGGLRNAGIGTCYALLDGAVCGALFGWLYNTVSDRVKTA